MHAISSYRGNRPAHTHTLLDRQDRLQYTAPQLARNVTTPKVISVASYRVETRACQNRVWFPSSPAAVDVCIIRYINQIYAANRRGH